MARTVSIVVLHNDSCPATPKTIALIRECISELAVDAVVRTVQVATQQEAEASRFLGSPTVQVDGVDIDPAARGAGTFGFM